MTKFYCKVVQKLKLLKHSIQTLFFDDYQTKVNSLFQAIFRISNCFYQSKKKTKERKTVKLTTITHTRFLIKSEHACKFLAILVLRNVEKSKNGMVEFKKKPVLFRT